MKEIKYKDFSIKTALEDVITIDNFHQYNLFIFDNKGKYVTTIYRTEVCYDDVISLHSEDENLAKLALKNISHNRMYQARVLLDIPHHREILAQSLHDQLT